MPRCLAAVASASIVNEISACVFRSEDHQYFVDGNQSNGSVTGMIPSFCKSFDADALFHIADPIFCEFTAPFHLHIVEDAQGIPCSKGPT